MNRNSQKCLLCRKECDEPKAPIIPHGIKYKDTCSICWEDMIYPEDRNLATFKECGHTFHNECIKTWMDFNSESEQIIINNNVIINFTELQFFNPTSEWRYDLGLNQWVLIDIASGHLSWQEETPHYFLQDHTPIWLNYPRCIRYRRKWILVPNEIIHLYTTPPIISDYYFPSGIFNTWIFDDDLSEYVLVDNESGYLSWQAEIPETNLSNYIPQWIDNQDTGKYHKRWALVPIIDPERWSEEYFDSDQD